MKNLSNSQPLPPPLTDQQQQIIDDAEAIEARSNRGWGPGGVAKQPAPQFNPKQLEALKIWDDIDNQDKKGWGRSKQMGFADMLRVEFTLKNMQAAQLAKEQPASLDKPLKTKPNNKHNNAYI